MPPVVPRCLRAAPGLAPTPADDGAGGPAPGRALPWWRGPLGEAITNRFLRPHRAPGRRAASPGLRLPPGPRTPQPRTGWGHPTRCCWAHGGPGLGPGSAGDVPGPLGEPGGLVPGGGSQAAGPGRDPKEADNTPLAGSVPLLRSWIPAGSPGCAGERGVRRGGVGGSAFWGAAAGCCGGGGLGSTRLRRSPRRRCCRPR